MRNKQQIIFEDTNKMVEAISFQKEAYDSSKHENITHIGHWFNFNIAMTGRYYDMFMQEYVGQKVRFLIIQIVAMFFLLVLASFHYFTGALSSANSLTLLIIIVFAYLLSCSVSMVKHIDSMTTMTKELVFNTFLLHDAVFQRVDTCNALTNDLTRHIVSQDTNISQEDARNLALDSIDDRRLVLDYLDAAINLLIAKHKINDILTTPKGSRVLRRDYGSRLPDLIDAPMNGETLVDVFAETAEALDLWEPRLKLRRVQVTKAASGQMTILLSGEVLGAETTISTEVTA